MVGCCELLTLFCTASSAASVSQDHQCMVLSLQSHMCWSYVRDDPQGTEEPSALCPLLDRSAMGFGDLFV